MLKLQHVLVEVVGGVHSEARMFKVSEKLIEMLNSQPKSTNKIFNCSKKGMQVTLFKTRKRLALKLGNQRLTRIHFHTFRHWKATMLYHETKDAHYVQHFLGHKSIKNTEIYIKSNTRSTIQADVTRNTPSVSPINPKKLPS